VLVSVNIAVFLCLLSRGLAWQEALSEYVEAAMIVELICLLSLSLLCVLRQIAIHRPRPMSAWLQRLACGVVPALLCGVLIAYLSSFEWFSISYPHLHADTAMSLSFVMGLVMQHYFELRNRAFSPALVEARLQALQARIRPHFLFNSLNAVLSLIRHEPRRAETALEDLADLFRVLMRDARDIGSLHDEVRLCEQYLAIEKLRLGERLQVRWNYNNLDEAELHNVQMASLLLQPLLENAVHYGIEPSLTPATVHIDLQRNMDKIEIKIVNPYHGEMAAPGGNQMALENIRGRLALLYDIEAQLSYRVIADEFEVKLYFPYKKIRTGNDS
jgi:two-component system sensor histidine kinase AlgZ